jgi:hypothetical protein
MELTYKGIAITVTFANNEHHFVFTKDGTRNRVIVNIPSVVDTSKQITINWTIMLLNTLDIPVGVPIRGQKIITDGGITYDEWYSYALTNFALHPSFNRVLSEVFNDLNLSCFKEGTWEFFQPIIFTLSSTLDSVTATKTDGSGTIKYSIDEGVTWVDSNIFTGLNQGTDYTIKAKNLEDEVVTSYSIKTKVELIQ